MTREHGTIGCAVVNTKFIVGRMLIMHPSLMCSLGIPLDNENKETKSSRPATVQ